MRSCAITFHFNLVTWETIWAVLLMIAKAGSANNRQQHTVRVLSLWVCIGVEFCSFSFLAIEPPVCVCGGTRSGKARGAHAIHGPRAEAPPTARWRATKTPIDHRARSSLTRQNPSRGRSGESDAAALAIRTRVCFLIQFFLVRGGRRATAHAPITQTDHARSSRTRKVHAKVCAPFSAHVFYLLAASASAAIIMEQTKLCCFPICLSDLRWLSVYIYMDHVKLD